MNEIDTIEKLVVGANRFEKDPSKPAANSFKHPWLGPMTRLKQSRLIFMLRGNAKGERLREELLDDVSGMGDSFKYIGGTAYRPDIAPPKRVIHEVRDCHTNLDCLMDKVFRTTYYFSEGRSSFRKASKLEAFDSIEVFEKLPENIQQFLEKVFPASFDPSKEYTKSEKIAMQVYRNFSWPMRSWDSLIHLLGVNKTIKVNLAREQAKYLVALEKIANDHKDNLIDTNTASLLVQGALVQFAKQTDLLRVMQDFEFRNLPPLPQGN